MERTRAVVAKDENIYWRTQVGGQPEKWSAETAGREAPPVSMCHALHAAALLSSASAHRDRPLAGFPRRPLLSIHRRLDVAALLADGTVGLLSLHTLQLLELLRLRGSCLPPGEASAPRHPGYRSPRANLPPARTYARHSPPPCTNPTPALAQALHRVPSAPRTLSLHRVRFCRWVTF